MLPRAAAVWVAILLAHAGMARARSGPVPSAPAVVYPWFAAGGGKCYPLFHLPFATIMAPKRKKPQRSDPYRNYTFRVKWDGQVVAGVSRVSALKRTTEIVEYREGGDAGATHKMPGRTH
jgi:hypothetical protein